MLRFESLVVMDFEVETPQETVDWVLSKLVSPHNSGGGQLLAIPVNVDADGKKVSGHSRAECFFQRSNTQRGSLVHLH